jgi:hypothetical protein
MREKASPALTNAMRLASIVTAANVLIASGFSIAGLIAPAALLPAKDAPSEASFIFAMYAAARTLPLALAALVAIYKRSAMAVLALGALAGLVQLVDAAIGLYQHDLGKTIGPLVIAALQFYAVFRLENAARSAP